MQFLKYKQLNEEQRKLTGTPVHEDDGFDLFADPGVGYFVLSAPDHMRHEFVDKFAALAYAKANRDAGTAVEHGSTS